MGEYLEEILRFLSRLHLQQGTVQVRSILNDGNAFTAEAVLSGDEADLLVTHTKLGRFSFMPTQTVWEPLGQGPITLADVDNRVGLAFLRGGLLPKLGWVVRALEAFPVGEGAIAEALGALQRIENQTTAILIPGVSWFNAQIGPVAFPGLTLPRVTGYLALRSVGLDLTGGTIALQLVLLNAVGQGVLQIGLGGDSQLELQNPGFNLDAELIFNLGTQAAALHLRQLTTTSTSGQARFNVGGASAPSQITLTNITGQLSELTVQSQGGTTSYKGGPINLSAAKATVAPRSFLGGDVTLNGPANLFDLSATLHIDLDSGTQVLRGRFDAPVVEGTAAVNVSGVQLTGFQGTLALRQGDFGPHHVGVIVETTAVTAQGVRITANDADVELAETTLSLAGSFRRQRNSTALEVRTARLTADNPTGKLTAGGFVARQFAASLALDGLAIENGVIQGGHLVGALFHSSGFSVTIPPEALSLPQAQLLLPSQPLPQARRLDLRARLGPGPATEDLAVDIGQVAVPVQRLQLQVDASVPPVIFEAETGPVIDVLLERLHYLSHRNAVTELGLAICAATRTQPRTLELKFEEVTLKIDVKDLKVSGWSGSPSDWTLAGRLRSDKAEVIYKGKTVQVLNADLRVLTDLFTPCPTPAAKQDLLVEFDVTAIIAPKILDQQNFTFTIPLNQDAIIAALRELIGAGSGIVAKLLNGLLDLFDATPFIDIELSAAITVGYRIEFVEGDTGKIKFRAAVFLKSVKFILKAFIEDGIPFVDLVRIKVAERDTGDLTINLQLRADLTVHYVIDLAAQRFRVRDIDIDNARVEVGGVPLIGNTFLLAILGELVEQVLRPHVQDQGLDLPSELTFRKLRLDFINDPNNIVLVATMQAEKIVWS